MKLIRGVQHLKHYRRWRGCAATIGNFDGLHLGHRHVLEQVRTAAQAADSASVAMVFEPQPSEYFLGADAPGRLMTLADKLDGLRDRGVDAVLCVRFDRDFAACAPAAFIQTVLVDGLGVRHLVIGDDFRFGRERAGDFSLLRRCGARLGYSVDRARAVMVDGLRVSSTQIRAAMAAGDFALAARLLGRPWAMSGRVAYGRQLGRTLGFPTANIALRRAVSPLSGVFAVWVDGIGAAPRPAVANIGPRPTVGGASWRLEAHILDFDGNLYGRRLGVRPVHKLRDVQAFSGLAALQARIAADVEQARAWFDRAAESGAQGSMSACAQ